VPDPEDPQEPSDPVITPITNGTTKWKMTISRFETGELSQITSLKIKNDVYPTNYVIKSNQRISAKHSRTSMAWRADVQRQGWRSG
jgi:hypothetical protein